MDWGRGPRKPPLGARANRSWLLAGRLSLTRRLHPMSRLSEPLRTTPHTKQCQLPDKNGVRPLFQSVNWEGTGAVIWLQKVEHVSV